jgi:hypothetical protein
LTRFQPIPASNKWPAQQPLSDRAFLTGDINQRKNFYGTSEFRTKN